MGKDPKEGLRSPTRAELDDVIALVESLHISDVPAARAADTVIDELAALLAKCGHLGSFSHGGTIFPQIDLRVPKTEFESQWVKRREEAATEISEETVATAGLVAAWRASKQSIEADQLEKLIQVIQERLVRALLRSGLRALGLSAKRVSDLIPNVADMKNPRSHLADFAIERLRFGDGKTARTRCTSREVYEAYTTWHREAKVSGMPLSMKAFATELARSEGVSRHTFGSDGDRERGWRGIGLKEPPPGPPGSYAREQNAAFLQVLGSSGFGKALEIARRFFRTGVLTVDDDVQPVDHVTDRSGS